jgi:sugar phosphate isomerase/epimerase
MDSSGDFAVVGAGAIDIPAMLKAAISAGVDHFHVECDRPMDPMREIRQSCAYLKALDK